MEYLVFNDASLPFNNMDDVNSQFPNFLKIIDFAFKNNMKAIRFSEEIDKGWYELELTSAYALHTWIKNLRKEEGIKTKILLSKFISKTIQPVIYEELREKYELSEFRLENDEGCKTPSLGACMYMKQLAVSCNSNKKWNKSFLKISTSELTEEGDNITVSEVNNCTTIEHWNEHFVVIESERKENLKKGNNLWKNRKSQFPNLEFVGDAPKQFPKLEISNILFSQLLNALYKLNSYIDKKDKTYTLEDLKTFSGLDISNEKETVRNNPKFNKSRTFKIDYKKMFFGFHIKNFSGSMRLHFILKESKIYIGYFGKHLPTKNDPK